VLLDDTYDGCPLFYGDASAILNQNAGTLKFMPSG
jgi:hypothetical protein